VRGTYFGNTLPCLKDDTQCKALTLFQREVLNASLASRQLGMGFHAWATQAPEQTDMETCHVLVAAQRSFLLIKNCASRNMNFETNHPPNMSHFSGWPSTHFNARQPKPPKHILTKTCNNFGSYVLTPCAHLPCSPMRYPSMKLLTFFNFPMLRLTFVKLLYQDN